MKQLVVTIGFLLLLISVPTFAQDLPQFEAADCPKDARLPPTFHCGYVTVLADHSHPDAGTLRLMVAVYHSDVKSTQPDPIIYLNGGPGGSSIDFGRGIMRVFGNFGDRDIVLFDQRGTGYSEPNMTCPEINQAFDTAVAQKRTPAEMRAGTLESYMTCYKRLLAEGINFAVINSAASAADVQDIRKALGYDQINLYGISYGTRLALTVMRDHPENIRSVILDSVYPPNIDNEADGAVNTQAIFDKVFAACAANPTCKDKYPDLETVFYAVVDTLNAHPVEVKLASRTLQMDGYGLISAVFSWLYNAAIIPDVPRLIYQLHDGDTSGLVTIVGFIMPNPGITAAMSYAVECQEEYPFNDASRFETSLNTLKPAMQSWMQMGHQTVQSICDVWNAGTGTPNPVENQAVKSDIPTLVLEGEFDPITPPSYGQLAARTLSHSYQIELPITGHGVLGSSVGLCVLVAAKDFIHDPAKAPEANCPASMPIQFD
ncbi:MAG: alpha/beta fold hydrolase [Chloroflexota bacterium]